MKAIVVGSGIVGASAAYHLIVRGAEVTIITGDSVGGLATNASFAWINSASGNPRPYFEFRLKAIMDWHRLERELKDSVGCIWSGSLWWEEEMISVYEKTEELISWGYPMRMLSQSEARNQEPGLRMHPVDSVYSELEGAASAPQMTRLLLDRAEHLGATIRPERVLALESTGGQITGVRTPSETIYSDEVVIAAGVSSPDLLSMVGVKLPLLNSEGLLACSLPRTKILRGVILSPKLHMRQDSDGRIIVGRDFKGTSSYFSYVEEARQLVDAARDMLIDRTLSFESFMVGKRPVPIDGLPVVGRPSRFSGLYIMAMHSGITLAPLVGRLGASEILRGHILSELQDYRPDRFS